MMDATERRDLYDSLLGRCEIIAARWYRVITRTALSPLPPSDVQRHLFALTDRTIHLLIADEFVAEEVAEVGAALARLRYLQPESLGSTQAVLGAELMAGLPAEQVASLQPRLAALLGEMTSGYFRQAQETILAEQETIRAALLAALRDSDTRFRVIFMGAAIGIILADLTGRTIESNPAIERILGYTSAELYGMAFTEVTYPGDVSASWEHFAALVAGRGDAYQMEKRYLHKAGHIVWGNLTSSLVRSEHGMPQFIIGMVEDITARKRMEMSLIEAQRRLAESREAERLHLAHELHDTAVQNLLDINLHLAEARKRAGERHKTEVPIATIAAVQEKVQEITARLRDHVRQLRPPGLEEFGLIAALEGYVVDLRQARPEMPTVVFDEQGTDTTMAISVSLPLFRAAQEALRNILEHANAQHVTLSIRIDAWGAVLSVRDDGVGFSVPSSLSNLARAGHFGLVGIMERVELVAGEMEIASWPGEGTLMTVRIPFVRYEGHDSGSDLRGSGQMDQTGQTYGTKARSPGYSNER